MLMCTLFDGGGGMRKYILYTQVNVDNFGRPLTTADTGTNAMSYSS